MIEEVFGAELPVGERFSIKRNVISSGSSQKRVCVVTGTHGDELEGQYVAFRLNRVLREHPEDLDGTVEIFPALNPLGIDSITRGIPNFDIDMNRIFPGSLSGSMTEAAARHIVDALQGADCVIDIHSSNIFLWEIPQVRINVNLQDTLVPLARLLNMDFIWVHEAATVLESTLAHSLNITGTPTLVVEMGVGMRIHEAPCDQLLEGILNLLQHLGMWRGKVPAHLTAPVVSSGNAVSFVNAPASGIFIARAAVNAMVRKGDPIGQIVSSLTGDILADVSSPADGLLFTLRAYPVVYEGSLLARIHSFSSEESNA